MQVQLRPETEGKVEGKRTQAHQWNTADTITSVRIAASLVLLFFSLDYTWFLIIYTITGLTDALDGWLARRTGTASEFGARLDSIADLLFYGGLSACTCRVGVGAADPSVLSGILR